MADWEVIHFDCPRHGATQAIIKSVWREGSKPRCVRCIIRRLEARGGDETADDLRRLLDDEIRTEEDALSRKAEEDFYTSLLLGPRP